MKKGIELRSKEVTVPLVDQRAKVYEGGEGAKGICK